MEHIDARRALELLTDIVDQYGEDVVYAKVQLDHGHGTGCRYEYNGKPSCLVGIALFRAGAQLAQLQELDIGGTPAERIFGVIPETNSGAARVFQAAQSVQDRGDSWGEALDQARKSYELMASRGQTE